MVHAGTMQWKRGNEELNRVLSDGIEAVMNLVERWVDLDRRIIAKIEGGRFAPAYGSEFLIVR